MTRVCGVFGTWQLIALIASLHQEKAANRRGGSAAPAEYCQDYLILYETAGVPQEFKEILQRMAEALWPWKRIVWAYDILLNERRIPQSRYDSALAEIRERLGLTPDAVDQLWVCFLTRPAEKLLFAAFPKASITLYEDGLMTYLDASLARLDGEGETGILPAMRTFLRGSWEAKFPVRRFRRSRWHIDVRHQKRLQGNYLLLTKNAALTPALMCAPVRYVDDRFVCQALQDAAHVLPPNVAALDSPGIAGAAPRALVLGQALSRNGILSREEETAFYQRVIATVLEKGYAILWKDHPRVSEPFFEDLRDFAIARAGKDTGQMTRFSLPHAYPVEIIADRLNLSACVAGTSAALFYLRRLFDIPCYTFAGELLPRMRGDDVTINDIVRREIPPLEDLPHAPAAPGREKVNV